MLWRGSCGASVEESTLCCQQKTNVYDGVVECKIVQLGAQPGLLVLSLSKYRSGQPEGLGLPATARRT